MPSVRNILFAVVAFLCARDAASSQYRYNARSNPIRKVTKLLMKMQKTVQAEGEQMKELHDKFLCDAKKVTARLEKEIKDAGERIPQLESGIKQLTSEHEQLAVDLEQAAQDRTKAEEAVATANALRKKAAADFAKESVSQRQDAESCAKAIAAVKKGQAGSAFLQSKSSSDLRRLSLSTDIELNDDDRSVLTSFLEGGEEQPSSGEVLGILKQMHSDMLESLAEMQAAEKSSIEDHQALTLAKTKELKATTKAIEVKTGRKGEVSVEISKLKHDLEDTQQGFNGDGKLLAETKKSIKVKDREWDSYSKVHSEEKVALSETIKILSDSDSSALLQKTLPYDHATSFLQIAVSAKSVSHDAIHALRHGQHRGHRDARLSLLALALQGKQGGNFNIVLEKIDKLVKSLKKEQQADVEKKEWCAAEVGKTKDEVKSTDRSVSDASKIIASAKEQLKAILEDIAEVSKGIKEMDDAVQKATKQRKAESTASNKALAESGAAQELLRVASDRLNRFYNPSLAAKPKLLQEDDAGEDDSDDDDAEFVQIRMHSRLSSNLQESSIADHRYAKRSSANGVLQMLSLLREEVSKQSAEMSAEEKVAQQTYEVFIKDAAEKRAVDSKSLEDKESAKAKVETEVQKAKESKQGHVDALVEANRELAQLHTDCDWLMKAFDDRKKAREDETDALKKARAVLSGAAYS